MTQQKYDLIIIGGGMVGAGFALSLRQTGLKIAVVDARLPSNDDPRLFALNVSSCEFLQNLGLWQQLEPYASPIKQVHVSNQGRFGAVRLNHQDAGLPLLGNVIPACHIETALNDALDSMPDADLYRPARLVNLQQNDNDAQVTLEMDGSEITISSSIIIGADGTGSTVRKLINIPVDVVDYQQSAIVTRIHPGRAHQNIAYERFNTKGAIAVLPLQGHECACIWSTGNEDAQELMALHDDDFSAALQKAFGYRLGRIQSVAKRHIFPLQMIRSERVMDRFVLLLGNSAHTLHPIAAQGFNLALYEVAVLSEGVMQRLNNGEAISTQYLSVMLEQTRRQQTISTKVSHWLAQMFASDSIPKQFLLSLGMAGFDSILPAKKKFIAMMTGRSGRVPSLLMRKD